MILFGAGLVTRFSSISEAQIGPLEMFLPRIFFFPRYVLNVISPLLLNLFSLLG